MSGSRRQLALLLTRYSSLNVSVMMIDFLPNTNLSQRPTVSSPPHYLMMTSCYFHHHHRHPNRYHWLSTSLVSQIFSLLPSAFPQLQTRQVLFIATYWLRYVQFL